MHPPPAWGKGKGLKIFEVFHGRSETFTLVGGYIVVEGVQVILKQKLKLLNTSIKSIFGITNLIYFRDI